MVRYVPCEQIAACRALGASVILVHQTVVQPRRHQLISGLLSPRMAWFSLPRSPPSRGSQKLSFPYQTRPFWRRPRLLSWSLCFLVLIAIVFWPPNRATITLNPSRNRPIGGQSRPRPRADADGPHLVPKKPKKNQRTPGQSERHVYRTDGLLDVNPKAKHPILELIERSETQWKRKIERQSKTLKQAVDEYKLRYKRSPPKGFQIWWVSTCTLTFSHGLAF